MSVRATSSWKVGAGNLASLVQVVATEEDWEGEAEDAEKCVRLQGDQERGEVILEAVPGKVVSWVGLTSSRPLWEVVGGLQYIASLRGQKFDLGEEEGEEEELAMFKGSLVLTPGHSRLTLRLPPSSTSPVWLFSLAVKLSPAPLPKTNGHFSLNSVDSLLTNSQPLSDKAQQFRSIFQAFQTSGPLSGIPQATMSHNSPTPLSSLVAPAQDGDTGNTPPQDSPPSAASLLLFKSYIDQKFEALEAKLLGAIAASEQAQSAKLDKILSMLEDQASK